MEINYPNPQNKSKHTYFQDTSSARSEISPPIWFPGMQRPSNSKEGGWSTFNNHGNNWILVTQQTSVVSTNRFDALDVDANKDDTQNGGSTEQKDTIQELKNAKVERSSNKEKEYTGDVGSEINKTRAEESNDNMGDGIHKEVGIRHQRKTTSEDNKAAKEARKMLNPTSWTDEVEDEENPNLGPNQSRKSSRLDSSYQEMTLI
ncbi:hypothetical protein GIB67_005665 [Kingdonia uniflora]|uniref:Uncharacterized protein n=1 Tax=Kingdonia uniflora TaxID=39325 RepID=A0A7J7NHT0_9MAGN|nr:hypothetical protein GIB67_005665 [Kingdonia uniflora]